MKTLIYKYNLIYIIEILTLSRKLFKDSTDLNDSRLFFYSSSFCFYILIFYEFTFKFFFI